MTDKDFKPNMAKVETRFYSKMGHGHYVEDTNASALTAKSDSTRSDLIIQTYKVPATGPVEVPEPDYTDEQLDSMLFSEDEDED